MEINYAKDIKEASQTPDDSVLIFVPLVIPVATASSYADLAQVATYGNLNDILINGELNNILTDE